MNIDPISKDELFLKKLAFYAVSKDQQIILFCEQPGEVIKYQEIILADGYTNVKSVYNGYQEFIHEGYPMEVRDDIIIWAVGAILIVVIVCSR